MLLKLLGRPEMLLSLRIGKAKASNLASILMIILYGGPRCFTKAKPWPRQHGYRPFVFQKEHQQDHKRI